MNKKIVKSWDDFPVYGEPGVDYEFTREFARHVLKDCWHWTDEEIDDVKAGLVESKDA